SDADGYSVATESPVKISQDGRYVTVAFDSGNGIPVTVIRDTALGHEDVVGSEIGGIEGAAFSPSGTKLLGYDAFRQAPAIYDLTAWTSDPSHCSGWSEVLEVPSQGCFREVNPSDPGVGFSVQLTPDETTFAAKAGEGTTIEFFDTATGILLPALTRV